MSIPRPLGASSIIRSTPLVISSPDPDPESDRYWTERDALVM